MKILKNLLIVLMLLVISTNVYAANETMVKKEKVIMKLVEDKIANLDFGKYGKFEKKKVAIDKENKTIDISLKVTNNQDEKKQQDPSLITEDVMGEVVLLIDGSDSMKKNNINYNGEVMKRSDLVYNSAKKLVEELFKRYSKIKIGVVEFATSTVVSEEGGINDAKKVTDKLENDKSAVDKAIEFIRTDKMGPRTNIQEGLKQAEQLLKTSTDNTAKKAIVILTDAIPNTATGVSFDFYTDASLVPTRDELKRISGTGVKVISMLIDMKDEEINISTENPKPTYKGQAEKLFGTTSSPVAGPVYYVTDNEVTDTVTKDILKELVPREIIVPGDIITVEYTLQNIVIKDYFPQNIVDNFDYEELTTNDGVSKTAQIDKNDNSITWIIPELKPNETKEVKYRLKLKPEVQKSVIGINLPTNKEVTIDYSENGEAKPPKKTTDTPVVALDILPDKPLPNTGSYILYTTLISGGMVLLIGILNILKSKKLTK